MALTDVVANGIASATGGIAKAQIRIKDNRSKWNAATIQKKESVKTGGGGLSKFAGAYGAAGGVTGGLASATGKLGGLAEKAGSGIDAISGGKLGFNKENLLNSALEAGYNKVYEVQFNPSTLSLSARGGGTRFDTDHSKGRVTQDSKGDIFSTMSVRLLFNKVDNTSCFPTDSINLSLTNAMGTALKGVKSLFTDGGPSVQTTVEGFIGAVRDPSTVQICFTWGDLRYEGVLRSVSANYTMFDTAGRPVKAEVTLSIYLMDESIKNDAEIRLGNWQRAYDKAFTSSSSYVGTAQKLLRSVKDIV